MYEVFEKELNYITNKDLKEFIIECLKNAPEYFYHIPASSSGKYHPYQDLGEGGLINHTKAVVQVAMDLIRGEQFGNADNKDEIISACLLHDVIKNGFVNCERTAREHPLLASQFMDRIFNNSKYVESEKMKCKKEVIQNCIKSHMGIWNTDRNENEILPKPYTDIEKLVHLADYIASRKYVDMSLLKNETN